jgi:hypothetical protein
MYGDAEPLEPRQPHHHEVRQQKGITSDITSTHGPTRSSTATSPDLTPACASTQHIHVRDEEVGNISGETAALSVPSSYAGGTAPTGQIEPLRVDKRSPGSLLGRSCGHFCDQDGAGWAGARRHGRDAASVTMLVAAT